MDKFPLYSDGRIIGELTADRESLYTWFEARCRLPGQGLWCAWAVGEREELRLGVLEPAGERAVIRRRFSDRLTAPLGRLLRGEVRPSVAEAEKWEQMGDAIHLFRTPALREALRGADGALTRKQGDCRWIALPYDPKRPFPLTGMFCFAKVRCIQGKPYTVYQFNQEELPVFP
ncbi:hypothetical protein SAMN05216343_12122 [Oscillibacter sp. PC13]|uniref:hypothetical protein n=1 Tax=Oscillibacter sp. PC13 TaxID=1855299 RepID=UPI0008EE6F21|nr:hypothetical protein [Oscillibacter sp. PC13]SFQ02640.1 hypothetical protein SAMN05216343_12122 [Oscillibacter sp. PC13]